MAVKSSEVTTKKPQVSVLRLTQQSIKDGITAGEPTGTKNKKIDLHES